MLKNQLRTEHRSGTHSLGNEFLARSITDRTPVNLVVRFQRKDRFLTAHHSCLSNALVRTAQSNSITMDIDQKELETLFESVCDRARETAIQSNNAVVRQARRRLNEGMDDGSGLHVVAACSLVRNHPVRALDLLQKDSHSFPTDPVRNRLAGYAWLAQKEVNRAKSCFHRAVRLDPNQPDCWGWLGKIAEQENLDDEAEQFYQRGILFDDGKHGSALALSKLHSKRHRLKDSIHTLRVCLIRDRRSAQLNLALAKLLDRRAFLLGRRRRFQIQKRVRQEALECYRIVNATAPTSRCLVMQGRLEQLLFDFESARQSFQKAAKLAPDDASTLSHLAGANVDFGDIETAIIQFEESIAMDPHRAETHFRYTRAKRFQPCTATRRYIGELQKRLLQPEPVEQRSIYLNFAIAKVYDDIGKYDHAWKHYDQANRLKTSHSQSESKRDLSNIPRQNSLSELADTSISSFTEAYFASNQGIGNQSKKPVFIIGMPRSGTTLTEQILTSHPQIAGAGELNEINRIRQQIAFGRNNRHLASGTNRLEEAIEPKQGCGFPEIFTQADPVELQAYSDEYLSILSRFGTDHLRITDKMPTNFMYLGLIATLFPGATVVHCRRNPMDVLVSCYCQNLNAPFCDLDQLVDYHRNYRRMMAHWQQVLPIQIHTSDYESMVTDPETNTRSLIQHCGLEWSDACLRFHANKRAVHTPSKWQVRQPMYKSSVEKWRRFEKQLAPIANQIAREIESET